MSDSPATKYVAIGIAAVALTFGAYLVGRSNTSTTPTDSARSVPAAGAQGGQAPQGALQLPQTGQGGQLPPGTQNGQAPPGLGTPVTGATAAKLDALVTARYPGEIERTMKLGDGSYVVHVITSGGELHVAVSKAFKITGDDEGGQAPAGGSGVQS